MKQDDKIFVAGHRGLAGSAIVRHLQALGYSRLLLRSRAEVDLLRQEAVERLFADEKPEHVIVAAARVGGIYANSTEQADFLFENVMIAANVIHAAAQNNVEKLLFLGSSCIYPRMAEQPIREESLLTSSFEPTNEGYALAKVVGVKLCELYRRQYGRNFISAMPTNLYGEGDNYHPMNSHVIPGMMRRFHEAKLASAPQVVVWGTGSPRREFLHVEDLARAVEVLMQTYEEAQTINVGTGSDIMIRDLAHLMAEVTGYSGEIVFDSSKPDGVPRKVLDTRRITRLGWQPRISLRDGLARTYEWAVAEGAFTRAA
jgi:GDP-L-fucose synthase